MTRAEFLKKYGHVEVEFQSYYKFSFTFAGEVDGEPITVSVGGNADEIYRLEVAEGCKETIASLDPYMGQCGEDELYDY